MPITLKKSVGRGGVNRREDVAALQAQMNTVVDELGLPALVVNGTADAATIAAIVEFQRRVVKLASPDGCIDPDGKTLKALNAHGPASAPAPAAAPVREVRVTYSVGVEDAVRIVSDYSIQVIEKALVAAGVDAAVITSTLRVPAEQAAIMYGKASQDLVAQFQLYGATGDEVLQVFKANRHKPRAEVIRMMTARIEALHDQGKRVSLHVSTPEQYAKLNVIDIGMNSTAAAAGASYSKAKLTGAFGALEAEGYITKLIDETMKPNKCWHLEIVPGAKPL